MQPGNFSQAGGYFIEEGGDHTYVVGDLGLGGAAQTGVAILLDTKAKTFAKAPKAKGLK